MSFLSFYWLPEGAELKACANNIIFNQDYIWPFYFQAHTLKSKEVLSRGQIVRALNITGIYTISLEEL